jgi:hypothetical protein
MARPTTQLALSPDYRLAQGRTGVDLLRDERLVQTPLEHDFTVVHWGQRGAGTIYASNNADAVRPTLTFDRMKADTQ